MDHWQSVKYKSATIKAWWPACTAASSKDRWIEAYSIVLTSLEKLDCPPFSRVFCKKILQKWNTCFIKKRQSDWTKTYFISIQDFKKNFGAKLQILILRIICESFLSTFNCFFSIKFWKPVWKSHFQIILKSKLGDLRQAPQKNEPAGKNFKTGTL